MRHEPLEGRDREVEDEPAARVPAAQEEELNQDNDNDDESEDSDTAIRRGSSSERNEK